MWRRQLRTTGQSESPVRPSVHDHHSPVPRSHSSNCATEPTDTIPPFCHCLISAFARIENHYFVNGGWMRDGQLLEKQEIDKIRHIPTVSDSLHLYG